MKPGLGAFALTLALACMLLPGTSVLLEKVDAKSSKSNETGLISLHSTEKEVVNAGELNGLDSLIDKMETQKSKAGRRRRRGKKTSSKTSRRRRRGGKTSTSTRRRRRAASRRRRRAAGGGTKPAPKPAPKPKPAATKADAKPSKIEAGWGDMAKMGEFFTLFISGSGFDPEKDRALVIHGDDTCGSPSARIATTLGSGDVPSGVGGWSSLKCNGLTSGSSKLACGNGEKGGDGVMFPDDKWVDTYGFKVCVCDYSKKNRCSSKSDFDATPSRPTLTVNPVV